MITMGYEFETLTDGSIRRERRHRAPVKSREREESEMAGSDTAADLAELLARLQIKQAMDNYALGIDMRDLDRFLLAWHEDAVFDVDHPAQICNGHAEIQGWVEGVWESFDVLNHLSTNHVIDFVDDTHATGIGHAGAMFVMADGAYVTAAAVFDDRYELRDGVWRMAFRKVDVNHLTQHPGAVTTVRPANPAIEA